MLTASFLGWLFDGYEQGLFGVIARPALHDVLGGARDAQIGPWVGHITACFLIGAAVGGIAFGWLGDRIGRVRAMGLSILTYSLDYGPRVLCCKLPGNWDASGPYPHWAWAGSGRWALRW